MIKSEFHLAIFELTTLEGKFNPLTPKGSPFDE